MKSLNLHPPTSRVWKAVGLDPSGSGIKIKRFVQYFVALVGSLVKILLRQLIKFKYSAALENLSLVSYPK